MLAQGGYYKLITNSPLGSISKHVKTNSITQNEIGAYKNLFDWASRIETKVYQNKPMVLLATSPGRRGGASVLESALKIIPHLGGDIRGSLSIPQFNDNFDSNKGQLTDPELQAKLHATVSSLLSN